MLNKKMKQFLQDKRNVVIAALAALTIYLWLENGTRALISVFAGAIFAAVLDVLLNWKNSS